MRIYVYIYRFTPFFFSNPYELNSDSSSEIFPTSKPQTFLTTQLPLFEIYVDLLVRQARYPRRIRDDSLVPPVHFQRDQAADSWHLREPTFHRRARRKKERQRDREEEEEENGEAGDFSGPVINFLSRSVSFPVSLSLSLPLLPPVEINDEDEYEAV